MNKYDFVSDLELVDVFEYREGQLFWRIKTGRKVVPGTRAGAKTDGGYWLVKIGKRPIREHRAIWEMFNGPIPTGLMIDHIDQNRMNNRLENLRLVTPFQNNGNQPKRVKGSSDYKGVAWLKQRNCFRASIQVDRKQYHLGCFKTQEEAAEVYNAAATKHFGDFASLNVIQEII